MSCIRQSWLGLVGLALSHLALADENQDQVYLHTDNHQDFYAFNTKQSLSLSTETNMLALGVLQSEVNIELMPLKRSMKFMDAGQNVCVINKIKTKLRASKYLFSAPVNLFFNRRLYQNKNLEQLSTESPVDLNKLVNTYPNRKIVISSQISYGEELDAILADLPAESLIVRESASQGRGIIEMFHQGRADYAILHPQELVNLGFDFQANNYEIANTQAYVLGHVMCADTPKNREFLTRLNSNIQINVRSGQLYYAHLKHIDKPYQSAFSRYYHHAF